MQKVKLWTIFVLTVILLSQCATPKKCLQKFPPEVIRERYDSIVIKDTVIYKDREVPFYIKGDTIEVEKKIPVKENIAPLTLSNDYAIASAWVENSKLKLSLIQKDQVIKLKLDSADKEVRHWQFQYLKERELKNQVVREKYIPKLYQVAFFAMLVELIALIVWVALKIKGGWLKSLKNRFFS